MNGIETRLLGAAIESAAGKLPAGWMVSINIELGGYGVSLCDPNGKDVDIEQSEDLVGDINNAIAEAITINSMDDEE